MGEFIFLITGLMSKIVNKIRTSKIFMSLTILIEYMQTILQYTKIVMTFE